MAKSITMSTSPGSNARRTAAPQAGGVAGIVSLPTVTRTHPVRGAAEQRLELEGLSRSRSPDPLISNDILRG